MLEVSIISTVLRSNSIINLSILIVSNLSYVRFPRSFRRRARIIVLSEEISEDVFIYLIQFEYSFVLDKNFTLNAIEAVSIFTGMYLSTIRAALFAKALRAMINN